MKINGDGQEGGECRQEGRGGGGQEDVGEGLEGGSVM